MTGSKDGGVARASGVELVAFIERLGTSGSVNPNTAGLLRSAVVAVLDAAVPAWEKADIRRIDVERAVERFRRDAGTRMTEQTKRTYESAFRRTIKSYLSYLNDPDDWPLPVRRRRSTKAEFDDTPDGRLPAPQAAFDVDAPTDLPIPLPDGRTVRLTLPGDLSVEDVAFLREIVPMYLQRVRTRDAATGTRRVPHETRPA